MVKRKTLVDLVNGQVIGELSTFDHFGESALLTAMRRHFLRTAGFGVSAGGTKAQTRNATVIAKVEADDGVDTMILTGEELEKLLRGDNNIDVEALMQVCKEEHVEREALTKARQVWQRSGARERLRQGKEESER